MDDVSEQFDDPALKSAVRRACGKPAAPERLRERVSALVASSAIAATIAPAPPQSPDRWSRLQRMPRPSGKLVAAAALALFTVGFAFYQVQEQFGIFGGPSMAPPRPVAFNATFADALVRAHEACGKLADHHIVAGNDFEAVRKQLAAQQNVAVFAAAIGDGWQFRGAGMCSVGDVKAAHLLFVRGGETASVFSMPSIDPLCAPVTYEQSCAHDALAGFVKDNTLYTVVVSKAGGDAEARRATTVMQAVQASIYGSECSTQAAPATTAQ